MLQVYFLIRNIDRWTVGKFRDRVIKGVGDLVEGILHKDESFHPWRRVGDLTPVLANTRKENVLNTSTTVTSTSSAPSPPKKAKRRRAR